MNINELSEYLKGLPEEIISGAAEIVAETATEEFKQSFKRKSFDGNPWKEAKHPRSNGSLLIDSGALVNSIRPAVASIERVVISAGNSKVNYAKVHNEGFNGDVTIPAHTRNVKARSVEVPEYTRKTKSGSVKIEAHTWNIKGGAQQIKAHKRRVNIIQRQFMGDSSEINKIIHKRVEGYVKAITNQKNK